MFLRNGKRISHSDRDFVINNGHIEQVVTPIEKRLERVCFSKDWNINIENGAMIVEGLKKPFFYSTPHPIIVLVLFAGFIVFGPIIWTIISNCL